MITVSSWFTCQTLRLRGVRTKVSLWPITYEHLDSYRISKVFDRVWYEGLLEKLSSSGFSSALESWTSIFPSTWTISIQIDGVPSQSFTFIEDAPRNSELASTLIFPFIDAHPRILPTQSIPLPITPFSVVFSLTALLARPRCSVLNIHPWPSYCETIMLT